MNTAILYLFIFLYALSLDQLIHKNTCHEKTKT